MVCVCVSVSVCVCRSSVWMVGWVSVSVCMCVCVYRCVDGWVGVYSLPLCYKAAVQNMSNKINGDF